jgi:type I restriction enzyme S subunit
MIEQKAIKVPQIRFKEFEGEWEDRTIGEALFEKKRPVVLKDHQRYELITVKRRNEGIVSRGHLFGRDILVKNYSQLQTGDFVISKRQVVHGATGIIPPELDGAIVSNEYLVAVNSRKLLTEFLTILASLPAMRQKFFLSSYGVDIEKLFFDAEDWKRRNVPIPRISEQSLIGEYFRELDRLIELHQRKHDKMAALKQAMLQKMFPQPGASVPEIRFKGFSGAWVERRLRDVCEIVGGGTPSTAIREYWGGNIDWYSPTEIGEKVYAGGSVKRITPLGLAKCSARILPPNKTILFTSRAGIGDMAILIKEGCTSQGFQSLVLNDDVDPYFMFSMGYLIKAYALKNASGSTFLEISSKQLGNMGILVPNRSEQKKIGAHFRTLDELIAKHAIQCQKLKQVKFACLEKMFV